MGPVLLAALITGIAADGVYLDEGTDHGVRVGDVVVVGAATLRVVDVARRSARTEPAPHPQALAIGQRADVRKSGAMAAPASGGGGAPDAQASPAGVLAPRPTGAGAGDAQASPAGDLAPRPTGAGAGDAQASPAGGASAPTSEGAGALGQRAAAAGGRKQAPRPTPPPPPDDEQARAWWAVASDGWATPRPFAGGSPRPSDAGGDAWALRGHFGVRGVGVDTADRDAALRAAFESRLAATYGAFEYAHDLRFNADAHDGRGELPLVEAWQLEGGFRASTWRARGGRLALGELLAVGALDGAAVEAGPARVFAGFAPDSRTLSLDPDAPQLGAGVAGEADVGPFTALADLSVLASLYRGALDRTAVAPQLRLVGDPLTLTTLAEVDAWLGHDPRGRGTVDASRLYAAADARVLSWLDLGARYDRYREPATRERAADELPIESDARQDAWFDARVDAGPAGVFVPSFGILIDPEEVSYTPGIDWFVPIVSWLNASAGWFMTDTDSASIQQGRARLTVRLDAPWPMELEGGGRMAWIRVPGRDETDAERTGELGLHAWLPVGADLHLYAEQTYADVDRTVLFGDLRWRFGP